MKFKLSLKRGWLLLCVFTFSCIAQDARQVDSLKLLLNKAKTDSDQVKLLNQLAYILGTSNHTLAVKYCRQAIDISARNTYENALCQAYNNMGILFDEEGKVDSTLFYYEKSLVLAHKSPYKPLEAAALGNIGFIWWSRGNYDKALNYSLKSLAVFERTDSYVNIAATLEYLGMIYYDFKDRANSIKYHRLALAQYAKINNEADLGNVYSNLSLNYVETNKDSTLYYLKKAEAIFKKHENHWSLGRLYTNIGDLYLEMGQPGIALEYLETAVKEHHAVNDERGLSASNSSLGRIWLVKGNVDKAKKYLDLAIAAEIKTDTKDELMKSYRSYAMVYAKLGIPDSVEEYLSREEALRDSLFSQNKATAIADMQTKYETEKKDLQLAKNHAELEIKEEQVFIKNIIIAAVICLLLLLGSSGYLFYRKKQVQQKAELDAELMHEKELRNRSVIEAEEKERIRIATDLHDGVGQLLSAAKLNLSSLEGRLNMETEEQKNAFDNAISLLDDSVSEVRLVSHNMMPNTLLKYGLGSAVKEFITKMQGMPDLKVNLEIVGLDKRMELEKETVLYRVIQEIVSNIIKHARASELTLQMIQHDKELSIVVEDNGVGFDTSRINSFEGIGLKNILSRVEFINGKVHFDSAPNRGTTVLIDVGI